MTTSHTPGSWKIETGVQRDPADAVTVYLDEPDARPSQWVAIANAYPCGALNAEANARLIAAAPELLDACNEVKAFYAGRVTNSDEQRFMHKIWNAIAKAEGAPINIVDAEIVK